MRSEGIAPKKNGKTKRKKRWVACSLRCVFCISNIQPNSTWDARNEWMNEYESIVSTWKRTRHAPLSRCTTQERDDSLDPAGGSFSIRSVCILLIQMPTRYERHSIRSSVRCQLEWRKTLAECIMRCGAVRSTANAMKNVRMNGWIECVDRTNKSNHE